MRTLRFEIEIQLDDLAPEKRAEFCQLSGCEDAEIEKAADVDIKRLGSMIAYNLAHDEISPAQEFWAGSDIFARFSPDGEGRTVRLVGARDMGAIAADPRSAWGTGEAHRNTLAALKALLSAKLHGNGAAAWSRIIEKAERAIEQSEALLPKLARPIDEPERKKLCQHRDTGRGQCSDCGEFL